MSEEPKQDEHQLPRTPEPENMYQLPTTTAHQSRLQIFQATRRPKQTVRVIETHWGTATVDGCVGQSHADVLEAIMSEAHNHRILESGDMQILVDPYRVRMSAGGDKLSGAQLTSLIRDLMKVVITMKISVTGMKIMGHIVNRVIESKIDAPRKVGTLSGKAKMWRVDIPSEFVQLIQGDLHLHYDPKQIAQLTNGISQAVARHVLTHRHQPNGGWMVDGLIDAVGAGESSDAIRNRRRELKSDAEGLKELGLVIEDGRLKKLH